MKLDRTFSKEIEKVTNGDGSREARFAFLKSARVAATELSTIKVADVFNDVIKKYGRVVVAICVAVTILKRENRLKYTTCQWAFEVLKLWHNRPYNIWCVAINDGLHPTRIEEYAEFLIRATSEAAVL